MHYDCRQEVPTLRCSCVFSLAALTIVGLGCRSRGPSPYLESIVPTEIQKGEGAVLLLHGVFQLPLVGDLDDPSQSSVDAYEIWLVADGGSVELPDGDFLSPTTVRTRVPADTPEGVYQVRVRDPWGREASLDALRVIARPTEQDTGDGGADSGFDGGADAGIVGGSEPIRSPPLARFEFQPVAVTPTQPLVFDGSGSTDSQTASSDLEVSWSYAQPAVAPPWTPWTTAKLAETTLAAGRNTVVLAVRDRDGDIGYAARQTFVAGKGADLCIVTTASEEDDGAQDCVSNFGTDGQLSFGEAVRLSNSTVQTQTIVFSGPLVLSGPPVSFTSPAHVMGSPGVRFEREIVVEAGPVFLSGLEVTGAQGMITLFHSEEAELTDSEVHDSPGVLAVGKLRVRRTSFHRCVGTCITLNGSSAQLWVDQSSFFGSGSGVGIDAPQCNRVGSGTTLDLVGNTFTGFATAIRIGPICYDPSRIVHQTFHRNGVAIAYAGGELHLLRNNIFSEQSTSAVQGCSAVTFSARSNNLLYLNASDDCLQSDPGAISIDPLYVAPSSGDFRLRWGSGAIDAAPVMSDSAGTLDVNGPFPGLYQGLGPDFGGRETY